MIVFIDECKAKRYIFALHLVHPKKQANLRRFLVKLLLPGQRSIHFRKENPRRRRQLIKSFIKEDLRVVILRQTETNRTPSRTALIKAIHGQITNLGATELVFELDETARAHDSKLLSDLQTKIL